MSMINFDVIVAAFTASVITWMIFGIVIGMLAQFFDRGDVKGGILGTILIAIIGSILGGLIGDLIFGISTVGVNGQSFLVAVLGGVILVTLERWVLRNREHIKTKVTRLE